MVSWEVQGEKNSYKITGTTESDRGYVAMGFSNDTYMGADSVVGCYQLDAFGVTMNRFKNVPNGKSNQGLVDVIETYTNIIATLVIICQYVNFCILLLLDSTPWTHSNLNICE